MMSHLCSAYFGRGSYRVKEKVDVKALPRVEDKENDVPRTTRAPSNGQLPQLTIRDYNQEDVYGFLPGRRGMQKPILSDTSFTVDSGIDSFGSGTSLDASPPDRRKPCRTHRRFEQGSLYSIDTNSSMSHFSVYSDCLDTTCDSSLDFGSRLLPPPPEKPQNEVLCRKFTSLQNIHISHTRTPDVTPAPLPRISDVTDSLPSIEPGDTTPAPLPKSPELTPRQLHTPTIPECSTEKPPLPMRRFSSMQNIKTSTPLHSDSQNTLRQSKRRPKSYKEFACTLDRSNRFRPVNIPMIVMKDCTASEAEQGDRLQVESGTIVTALYKNDDWVYVRSPEDRVGFVPLSHLEPLGVKRSMDEYSQNGSSDEGFLGDQSFSESCNDNMFELDSDCESLFKSELDISYCSRNQCSLASLDNTSFSSTIGRGLSLSDLSTSTCSSCSDLLELTVMFDFESEDDNDVTVLPGDTVYVLNDDDPDWLWVRRTDGAEGYIPRVYASDLRALRLDPSVKSTYC